MLLSIFAVVLGVVIIGSAIAADRSARNARPFRAVLLNLLGIGCLALGLVSVFAWSNRGIQRNYQIAAAIPSEDSTVVVRMVIGDNGQLEYPVSGQSSSDQSADFVEVEAEALVEVEAESTATELEAEADPVLAEADPPAEVVDETTARRDVETEMLLRQIELEGLQEGAQDATDPVIARVEIDYEARPEWVDQPDRDLGDRHLISITGGPFTTRRQARQELDKELKVKTDQYIREFLGHPHAAHWIGYNAQEIRHRFVAPDRIFDEKVRSPSFGDMYQSHALLEFGPTFHNEVERNWHQVLARTQLVKVALAGGAILGMLVMLFGYFNADSATRGFYSGRLKFVTALAILAVIATGFLIARSIPWLWL